MDITINGIQGSICSATGLLASHIVWYLQEIYPQQNPGGGILSFQTPKFLQIWFGEYNQQQQGSAASNSSSANSHSNTRHTSYGTAYQSSASQSNLRNRNSSSNSNSGYQWSSGGNRLG